MTGDERELRARDVARSVRLIVQDDVERDRMPEDKPVRVCVINDYDVIVHGTAALLAPHGDLVQVVECSVEGLPDAEVDIGLLDCFALPGDGAEMIEKVAGHANVGRVAVYSWGDAPELVDAAVAAGASGYFSKGLTGRALAEGLVAVHRGEQIVRVAEGRVDEDRVDARDDTARRWPGHQVGLTERESEVLALITQGQRTAEIATHLYLGVNSVKTHTQNLFRKIGVTSRTEAALWGVDHGFRPDRSTRDSWTPQP